MKIIITTESNFEIVSKRGPGSHNKINYFTKDWSSAVKLKAEEEDIVEISWRMSLIKLNIYPVYEPNSISWHNRTVIIITLFTATTQHYLPYFTFNSFFPIIDEQWAYHHSNSSKCSALMKTNDFWLNLKKLFSSAFQNG